ncbi:MAG: DUF805 domain-containing protein, partial [Bacteroidaceae bacterium]|nr:DUF805 domain-containing protein [Bacteroidaceae bacterium]
ISSGILAVILFILFLPTLALTVRRLHDTERNGTLILITVAPLVIMAVISILSVLFFTTTPKSQVSRTTDNGWRIIDVPDEYLAENGDVLWDSIKDPTVIKTYTYGDNGEIETDTSRQTDKANDRRMVAGTAGIMSMLFIFWIISFVLMIVWCSIPGTEGPNRYGPDPRMR